MGGDLPTDWQLRRIGAIAEVTSGQSPPGSTVRDWDGVAGGPGLPFIQGNAEFGRRNPAPARWCTAPAKRAEAGDTLLSVRAPVGETNRANTTLAIGRGLAAIRFHAVTPEFGWHSLNHVKEELQKLSQGSTFAAISGGVIRALELAVPPLAEQRAIASVLDAIDEAIERTEAVIAATESLRQALLHELLTRGLPGRHTEWTQVSGLGVSPKCWTVDRLGDAYEIELGKMVSPLARSGASKRRYLTNRNVRWGGFDLSDVPEMHFDLNELDRYRLRSGDLLVCEGGEVGRAAIWQEELAECYYQKALHRLRPRDLGQHARYLRLLLEYASQVGFLGDKAPQTSIAHLTRETLLRTSLPFPDSREQLAIAEAIESVEARIAANRQVLASLRVLRSGVADALLQGRVRTASHAPANRTGVR